MSTLNPGAILEGRYRIDKLLAVGGQARVYAATQLGLNRRVAIKTLHFLTSTPEVSSRMVRRFEQEAMLLSQLRDPHTITLYDYGRLSTGGLFMVFEYIDGISLKELIEREGPIDPARTAKILRQVLSSLQEAHALGVLHRDLKPANIMIYEHARRPDQVKLLDFGIAKVISEEAVEEALTGDNHIVGTPRYIAPEIFRQSSPSPASDLYSLGLVAYELLTGRPAIGGETAIDVMRNQLAMKRSRTLPPNLKLPGALRQIVERMIEIELSLRYAQAEEVLFDLQHAQQQRLPQRSDGYMAAPSSPIQTGEFVPSPHEAMQDDDLPTSHLRPEQLPWLFDKPSTTEILSSDAIPNLFATQGVGPSASPGHDASSAADEDEDDELSPHDQTVILAALPAVNSKAAILKRQRIRKIAASRPEGD